MPETNIQFPQKLNVWRRIISDRILEPVFLDGNLDGATHLTLLQEDLIPALAALFPNLLDPDLPYERILYINRAELYRIMLWSFVDILTKFIAIDGLEEEVTLNGRQDFRILLPSTFFSWGYLKSKVYVIKPNNIIKDLKQRIGMKLSKSHRKCYKT
jgi:hypothetical protein